MYRIRDEIARTRRRTDHEVLPQTVHLCMFADMLV